MAGAKLDFGDGKDCLEIYDKMGGEVYFNKEGTLNIRAFNSLESSYTDINLGEPELREIYEVLKQLFE